VIATFVRWTSAVSRVLILAVAIGSVSSVSAHADNDHDPCDGPAASASRLVVRSHAASDASSRHCDICHWLRVLRVSHIGGVAPLVRSAAWMPADTPLQSSPFDRPIDRLPARAPPR
jgi:hypothetical protein